MASQTGKEKHRQVHHLSREAGDPNGWVESITGLTADQPATDLLNNGSASKYKPTALVSCINHLRWHLKATATVFVALLTAFQLYMLKHFLP